MRLKSKLMLLIAFLVLAVPLIFMFTGNAGAIVDLTCLTADCHGNPALAKTIYVSGGTESVPLHVDIVAYNATVHGAAALPVECNQCHTDITGPGPHSVNKTYGGWARYSKSQNVEFITAGLESTRNYFSPAVAASCPICHTAQSAGATSAHATIYKLRGAHIDSGLTTCAGETIGEDYAVGNCNRCHAACQSCHFESNIVPKNAHNILEYWDQVQTCDKIDSGCTTAPSDSMSEFYMDRTTNIVSHEFRNGAYFATDADGVCEACHTGYNRPTRLAWYWKDGACESVRAANVRRHPQAYELWISGSTLLSPLTGGTNTTHAAMECAACHGTASTVAGNVHSLPGTAYDWSVSGDVQCGDCHANAHATAPFKVQVEKHITGSFANGIKVACTGCHTFGLGRDFELAKYGSSTSHDVFLDPETDEVRPVVSKNKEAIAWYSHNWQTLNTGTGTTDSNSDCAKKCHYTGNLVGAGVGPAGADHGADIVALVAVNGADAVCGICHTDIVTNTATCVTAACHGNPALARTIAVSGGTETVPLYVNEAVYYNPDIPHSNKLCVACHTDIVLSGGTHELAESKKYGGWARYSKSVSVEYVTRGLESTRNYFSTAVAASCATCHTAQSAGATSAHATIYKLRGAHIDSGLTACAGYTIGEDYAVGNCNRCHASCQSCHFESNIVPKNAHSILEYWDQVQTNDTIDGTTAPSDSMSEYYMDRTTNIASHQIRKKEYFATDADGVCEACHTGYNRPARDAWYWKDGACESVKAANVRRHPQAYELWISGSTLLSPLTGGTNTTHAAMECAACHGTASTVAGNVHSLPGTAYDWSTSGDVQCTNCHNSGVVHTTPAVAAHIDATGTKVACTGCHTFGLGRDFDLASTGSSTSHDVFLDPETNEVRPVVSKNKEAIAWYSHNWQTLTPGGCAQKCHYEGNLVGAALDSDCTSCHGTKTLTMAMGDIACTDCHTITHPTVPTATNCLTCHTSPATNGGGVVLTSDQATQYADNIHASTPIARFSATQSTDPANCYVVNFNAAGSTCPEGYSCTYTWDWENDGTDDLTTSSPTTSHDYVAAGTYTAELTVTATGGGSNSTTRSVTAVTCNSAPTCGTNGVTYDTNNRKIVTFTQSGAVVEPTDILYINWGDGSPLSAVSPNTGTQHTYALARQYTLRYMVKDSGGLSCKGSVAVDTRASACTVTVDTNANLAGATVYVKTLGGSTRCFGLTDAAGNKVCSGLAPQQYKVYIYKTAQTFDGDAGTAGNQMPVTMTCDGAMNGVETAIDTVTFTH